MKQRSVRFLESATNDLDAILIHLVPLAGARTAQGYVDRIVTLCEKLDLASERGQRRDDIIAGLRTVGFERRATIAFSVEADEVLVYRIFYGGQNWEAELSDE